MNTPSWINKFITNPDACTHPRYVSITKNGNLSNARFLYNQNGVNEAKFDIAILRDYHPENTYEVVAIEIDGKVAKEIKLP